MGKIVLDEEEERELVLYDRTNARWLPGARGPGSTLYHNPRTGQEFRLPHDPYSIARYSSRGLVLGKAPEYLRAQFAATPKTILAGVVEGTYDPLTPAPTAPEPAVNVSQGAAAPAGNQVSLAILEALKALTKEVATLKAQVNPPPPPKPEPKQLALFE